LWHRETKKPPREGEPGKKKEKKTRLVPDGEATDPRLSKRIEIRDEFKEPTSSCCCDTKKDRGKG